MMDCPFIIVTLCLAFSGCRSDVQAFCNQGGHLGIQRDVSFCNKLAVRVNSSFKPCSKKCRAVKQFMNPHSFTVPTSKRTEAEGESPHRHKENTGKGAPEQTWAEVNLQIILKISLNLLELSDNLAGVKQVVDHRVVCKVYIFTQRLCILYVSFYIVWLLKETDLFQQCPKTTYV